METSGASVKYYVYILYSLLDKGLYIGYSGNLKNRFAEHSSGRVDSTRFRRPLKTIHVEYFINIKDAKAREKYLKSGYGRNQIRQFLKNTFKDLELVDKVD